MGQCTSCEASRISSVPQSPEVEFPPKNLLSTSNIINTRKGEVLQPGSHLEDPSGISSTEDPTSGDPPIRGIRKLNPRRRHFFFFNHKPRVTFLSPEAELIESQRPRRSLVSTPNKRVLLHPTLRQESSSASAVIKTGSLTAHVLTSQSAANQEILTIHGKDSSATPAPLTTESAIMGNNLQKPTRKEGRALKKSSKLASPEVLRLSKSSPFGFGSTSASSLTYSNFKSSTSVGNYCPGSDNNNQNVQLTGFGNVPPSPSPSSFNTSVDLLNGNSVTSLSPATVQQLNSSRQEKNLLRARFFSESPPPLPQGGGTEMNKFGFKGTTSGSGATATCSTGVPPKGLRTFKYQPPAPTQVDREVCSAAGGCAGSSQWPILPPPSSASLTQLPNLNFVSTKLPQSKSTAALGGGTKPPPLTFPRKYHFNTESVPAAQPESQNLAKGQQGEGVSNLVSNVEGNGTHRGFGWVKSAAAESQVVKPVPTKPFFLLGSATSTSGFSGVSTGVVSQRKFLFESKDSGQGQRNPTRVTSTKAADENGNAGGTEQILHHVTLTNENLTQRPVTNFIVGAIPSTTSTKGATVSRFSIQPKNLNLDQRPPPLVTESHLGSARSGESVNLNSLASTSSRSDDELGAIQHGHGWVNKNVGAGQGQGSLVRPRSGRSQSRERDNPISDSEYLIDDEISDQPELTFNFKDSSLVPISRSSSEESLLPYDVTHPLPETENGTSDRIPFPTVGAFEETTTSDSAFSDVSSKPQDPAPPSKKSTGKVPSTSKWKMDSGRSSMVSTKLSLPSSTTHSSRLQQPKSSSKLPSPSADVVKKESLTTLRPIPPKFTPKVQQSRPRVSSTEKRVLTPGVLKGKGQTPTAAAKGPLSTTLLVSSSQKVTRASVPLTSSVKKKGGKTEPRIIEKPQRKSLSFRAGSSCSTTSNEEPPPPPLLSLHQEPVPVLNPEILEEIVQDFSGMKETLVELQMALEAYQRSDAEKDELIASLQAEVSSLQTRKCSCGRRLRYSSGGAQEDLDLEVFERDEENLLEESVVVRGSIFSDCSETDGDSPEKRSTSFISDHEERDKLGQLVSFRAGGRRSHPGHPRLQNSPSS